MLRSVEIELSVKFSPPFANTFSVSRNIMKRLGKINISFLMAILGLSTLNAQNYFDYYNQSNKGDSLRFYNQNEDALRNYETAFETVNFVHSDKLINAGLTAVKLHQFEKANSYFEAAITQSNNKSFLTMKEFKRNKNKFKTLSNKIPALEKIFEDRINKIYKSEIDSLYLIDQNSRGKKQSTEKIDDSNFAHLLSLIDEFGFPSEEKVGYESYKRARIILHHNLRLVKNEKYLKKFFEKYVINGEYRPEDYAWTLEQNLVWYNKSEPEYYFLILPTKNLTVEQKIAINSKRRKIGLKPIEAYKEGNNSFTPIW